MSYQSSVHYTLPTFREALPSMRLVLSYFSWHSLLSPQVRFYCTAKDLIKCMYQCIADPRDWLLVLQNSDVLQSKSTVSPQGLAMVFNIREKYAITQCDCLLPSSQWKSQVNCITQQKCHRFTAFFSPSLVCSCYPNVSVIDNCVISFSTSGTSGVIIIFSYRDKSSTSLFGSFSNLISPDTLLLLN